MRKLEIKIRLKNRISNNENYYFYFFVKREKKYLEGCRVLKKLTRQFFFFRSSGFSKRNLLRCINNFYLHGDTHARQSVRWQ